MYKHNTRDNTLSWRIESVGKDNSSGTLEFTIKGRSPVSHGCSSRTGPEIKVFDHRQVLIQKRVMPQQPDTPTNGSAVRGEVLAKNYSLTGTESD